MLNMLPNEDESMVRVGSAAREVTIGDSWAWIGGSSPHGVYFLTADRIFSAPVAKEATTGSTHACCSTIDYLVTRHLYDGELGGVFSLV